MYEVKNKVYIVGDRHEFVTMYKRMQQHSKLNNCTNHDISMLAEHHSISSISHFAGKLSDPLAHH